MSDPIKTTVSIHMAGERRREQDERTSDLMPLIHFGTLLVQPIKLCVLTSNPAESSADYETADRVFAHVRARLIQFSNEIESELGPSWRIMVQDGDSVRN